MEIKNINLINVNVSDVSIVNTGMLLYLDAGNKSSYSGSGSIWYDLSGNGYDASYFTGMTYSASNGGYFAFNGTGSAALPAGTYNKPYTGKSVFVVANCTTISNQYRAILGSTGSRNFNFYLYNGNGAYYLHFSTNGGGAISSPINYTPGTWFTAAATMSGSGGNISFYFNGQFVSSQSGGIFGQYIPGTNEYIGRADNYWYGPIATVAAYGKQLTATEVLQNHNAVRTRYGLS